MDPRITNETESDLNLDRPQQGGADKVPTGFNDLEEIDWTFGLKDELPGLKYLLTIEGPFNFVRGIINGTQMTKD